MNDDEKLVPWDNVFPTVYGGLPELRLAGNGLVVRGDVVVGRLIPDEEGRLHVGGTDIEISRHAVGYEPCILTREPSDKNKHEWQLQSERTEGIMVERKGTRPSLWVEDVG